VAESEEEKLRDRVRSTAITLSHIETRYMRQNHHRGMAHVDKGSHSFTCTPTRLSMNGMKLNLGDNLECRVGCCRLDLQTVM